MLVLNMNPVMSGNALPEVETVLEAPRAGVLLHPLRQQILREAQEPSSSTEIAGRLELPRQRVNYHVRELAKARFLHKAGRARKRNLWEQRWVATARSYQISPEVLGPAGADTGRIADRLSAAYLLALGERMQRELGRASLEAEVGGQRLSTLSVEGELRFDSSEQRRRFAVALHNAFTEVVLHHASPYRQAAGEESSGRPYRLVVGCYPTPATEGLPETGQPPVAPESAGDRET
jgi:hypothetical protein